MVCKSILKKTNALDIHDYNSVLAIVKVDLQTVHILYLDNMGYETAVYDMGSHSVKSATTQWIQAIHLLHGWLLF